MADKYPVQYAKILYKLMQDVPEKDHSAAIASFVGLLQKEQAIGKINYIIEEFEKISRLFDGTAPLSVTTAHELSETMKKDIEKKFEGTIETITIDKDIIGGVVVRKGNTILDTSIKSQLNQLAQTLK